MNVPITLKVEAKVAGQKRPVFSDYPLSLTTNDEGYTTLRDLIKELVNHEVQAFRQRQEERKLALVLSPAQIEQGAARGKIDLGERDLQQTVDEDAAIKTALQGFEDGLYYVFLDGTQLESLDVNVIVRNDSRLLFVRLVALAGG